LTVGIITASLFSFLAILAALLMSVLLPALKLIQWICWGGGYLLTVVVIGLQGYALRYNRYAVGQVQDEYNYMERYDDFAKYVADYEREATYHLRNFSFGIVPGIREAAGKGALEENWFAVAPVRTEYTPDPFMVAYREKVEGVAQYSRQAVASCAFDWFKLALEDDKFVNGPCHFSIDDGDPVACIGGWTGTRFKQYWCSLWEESEDLRKFLAKDPGLSAIQKRQRIEQVDRDLIDSMAGYYRHNTYLIGINVAGVVTSATSVVVDIFLGKNDTGARNIPEPKASNRADEDDRGAAPS
jgi:hypothetical protein